MNKKEIFREAAKMIANEKERFSCNAVNSVARSVGGGDYADCLRNEYEQLIVPKEGDFLCVQDFESGYEENYLSFEVHPKARLHRSLALLLAAEVLK